MSYQQQHLRVTRLPLIMISALFLVVFAELCFAHSNFDASVVEEDTWVRQLHQNGKRLLFVGDDTWQSMFPAKYFSRAFFYPSFDVKVRALNPHARILHES